MSKLGWFPIRVQSSYTSMMVQDDAGAVLMVDDTDERGSLTLSAKFLVAELSSQGVSRG